MTSGDGPTAPGLVRVGSLRVEVGEPVDLGDSPLGRRRMVAILGGRLEGELGTGTVLAGGADWQTVHDDGRVSVEAQYSIRLDDGVITLRSSGVRALSPDGSGVYFRASVLLTGPASRPDLNRTLFVSSGVRSGDTVHLDLYRVS
jgi:hypothetical protein